MSPSSSPILSAGLAVPLREGFVLVYCLGRSRHDEVWLARDKSGHKRVYKFARDPTGLAALESEAKHSTFTRQSIGERADIARVLDWNLERSPFFLEYEYEGDNLEQWAATHLALLSVNERITLFLHVADAVTALHGIGLLHKDLKPSNILVTLGDTGWQPVIFDLGAAGPPEVDPTQSQPGLTATGGESTPLYRAPELLGGGRPTLQSDVYALGLLLYQLVVGDIHALPVPGWERNVENPALRQVISNATDGNPEHRLASALDLAARLRRIMNAPQGVIASISPQVAAHQTAGARIQTFIGRDAELRILDDWAKAPDSPILVVHGLNGVGKTTLCEHWTRASSQGERPVVAHSFNASNVSLVDFCNATVSVLARAANLPYDNISLHEEGVSLLLGLLRARPCLLLIDGLEHVLASNEEMPQEGARAGEPDLTELLKAFAQSGPSKIVIISRVVPPALLSARRQPIPGVRLHALEGLRPSDAEQLLRDAGVVGTSETMRRFFEPIDCNPRLIRLVASSAGHFDTWVSTLISDAGLDADPLRRNKWDIRPLSVLLRKAFATSPQYPVVQDILMALSDQEELQARESIASGDFNRALGPLTHCVWADPSREARLAEEFSFVFLFGLEPGRVLLPVRRGESDALNWRRQIWSALATGSPDQLLPAKPLELDPLPSPEEALTSKLQRHLHGNQTASADQKGEQFEQAVARLFRTFFRIGEETPWKIRRQKRGTQDGYDLSIEWSGSCEVASDQKVRVHIECKNYSEPITQDQVGGKLLIEGQVDPAVIDHWILISPYTDPSNGLNRFLETHQKTPQYAFDVQVWSPESGVQELFGLEPAVYGELYGFEDGERDPRTWSNERREEVRTRWMARLRPPARLPAGWSGYARDPDKLCSPPETAALFQSAFAHAVPMRCLNSAGMLLDQPLRHYIDEWLERPDGQTLFILGEFGDGKTFFTYVLARDLMKQWVERHARGWLTLRLPLKKYPGSNAREFLRQRLEEFGADVAGWLELGKRARRLVILDGFDEMSVNVGPSAVTRNIGDLLACVKEFEGCKVLITSRTHFFESRVDAQRLMARLGDPAVYQLAPIERHEALRNIEAHLTRTLGLEIARDRVSRILQLNDPIGLAQKPLYLQMVKAVFSSPTIPQNLSVVELYETYINDSLNRNDNRLDDVEFLADPTQTIPNLRRILGELAEQLQRSGQGWVSLSRFQSQEQKPFAELLWRLSEGGEEQEKDARTRVGARSLLGRVPGGNCEGGWPVDFCHRSMREYFVAIRLCEKVAAGFDSGLEFLKAVPLNHEILHFAGEQWRKAGGPQVAARLLKIIREAVPRNNPGLSGGYALTLLYGLNSALPRDSDWRQKVLDGADLEEADLSGIDFSGSSFVSANLANANLESTSFIGCDLSGVHLEETKAIVSLTVGPSSNAIIALYGDGKLREWQLAGARATSQVALSVNLEPTSVVGQHDCGQLWLRRGHNWSFLARRKEGWLIEGTFPIREGHEYICARGDLLTYTRRTNEQAADVVVADITRREIIFSVTLNGAQRCEPLGTEGVIWSDSGGRLHVQTPGGEPSLLTQQAELETCGMLTSLVTSQSKQGLYLVAAGTEKGMISVWRVTLTGGQWTIERLLSRSSHQGVVTALAFVNDSLIASGGSDRAIVLVRLSGSEHPEGTEERRLLRTLRCRNMKIEGVKGPREYEMLKDYIAQSEKGVCVAAADSP
jgi:serine/threonine protein kinase